MCNKVKAKDHISDVSYRRRKCYPSGRKKIITDAREEGVEKNICYYLLLTANGFLPGGSGTTTIQRKTQINAQHTK